MQEETDEKKVTVSTTVQVKLEVDMHVAIKMICLGEEILMRDFYASAFEGFVEKRRRWIQEGHDLRRLYLAGPKDGKLISIGVFERHLEAIDSASETDGRSYRSAYYSAILDQVEAREEEGKDKLESRLGET